MNEVELIIDSVINYLEQGNQDLYAETVKQQAQEVERMRTAIQYALDNQPYMATRTVEICNELRQALQEKRQ